MVLLCSWPSFWLLVNYPSPGMLLTVVFVMVSFTTLGGVPVMLLISELLPKRIRALGFALVYSIGVAIFGGFAQYFATQSIVLLDSLTAPAWYLGGGTLLSMLALLYVKEPPKNCSKYVLLRYRSFTTLEQSSMFILWYSASSTFGKDSDIVMGVRAQQKKKPAVRWWKPHLAN